MGTLNASKYNNCIWDEDKELLVYNSLNKTYIKTKKYADRILQILENPDNSLDTKICNRLIEGGFVVDFEEEKKYADYKFYEYVFDNILELCIMPTEKCNFRCVYCYEEFLIGKLEQENINNLLIWLERNIHKYRGVRVSWFGGEPLLAMDSIQYISKKIIEICRANHIPYAASITTNGYLLNEDTFRKLLSYKVLSYQITIDGIQDIHDKNRKMANGIGTYEVIINNLMAISKNVKSGIFRIVIRNNVTLESLSFLNQFINEMYYRFSKDKRIGFYFRPVGKWGKKKIDVDGSNLINNFDGLYNIVLKSQKQLNYMPYKSMVEEQICFAQKRNQFVVRGNGEISKCTMLLENEKNSIGALKKGEMCIDEYKVSKWLNLSAIAPEKCHKCAMYAACYAHTCPAKSYAIDTKELCGYEGMSLDYILRILNKMDVFDNLDEVVNGY